MDKKQIARTLEVIADMMEIRGENPFKCNAHRNAARTLDALEEPLEELIESGRLTELKGIGESLAHKIIEMAQTGHSTVYDELAKEIPEGVLEMLSLSGMGPKKAKAVWEQLGIKSIGELEYACQENRLIELPGFGQKSQEKILKAIEYHKRQAGRFRCDVAWEIGTALLAHLRKDKKVIRSEIGGSLRRCKETIGDIDILASSDSPDVLMKHFLKSPGIEDVMAHGPTKSSVRMEQGIQVDLRIISDAEYPFALNYFTGSKEHNTALRGRAKKMGHKLNEYGLFRGESERSEKCADEAAIYKRLGLAYIEPELREDTGEIEAAEKGTLPHLVEEKDIKGLIHVHSTWSDGVLSIEQMARAAKKRGYEYVAICDHSQSAAYARGLSPARVREQHKEIDKLNKAGLGVRILKGIEVDVLSDGSLDFDNKVLATFELVVASIHSRFNLSREEQTKRLIRATANPNVHMIGHPTGRLLLSREGYDVDLDALIEAAAKHRKIIELNAHPFRLDLDWRYCIKAQRKGVRISINPDAHNEADIDHVRFGVGIARKGWCEPSGVVNAAALKEFLRSLRT
jgi:DNA polymerase (family 10)